MTASIASDGYAQWIEQLRVLGFEPWFVSFLFKQLPGSAAAREQQMLACVERAYTIRITRVLKHPRAASNRDRRPIWLAAPDLPIFKHLKQTLRLILANDGLHVHAIVLESIFRECPECIAYHMWEQQNLYRHLCPGLERIDVRAITHDVPRVTSYLFKQIEKR